MNKDILKTYAPSLLLYSGMTGREFLTNHDIMAKRYKELSKCLGVVEQNFEEYKRKVLYRFTTNNYKKMHHIPMRRKGV